MQTREEILSKIKPYLKNIMLGRLNENVRWTYVSFPEDKNKHELIQQIQYFIENKLDDFLKLCKEVLPYFSQTDNESIDNEFPTELAKKFINLFCYLEQNGFPGPRDFNKPINFWSGNIAKEKAFTIITEICDSKIPSISVMFDVCNAIQKTQQKYDDYILLLTSAVSRVFTSYAYGDVSVYINSEKLSELPGFTVTNNFWLVELPTLISLKEKHVISDIKIYLYNHHIKEWNASVSLFSEEGAKIPIRRRIIHPLDKKESADRFKTLDMSQEEEEKWYYTDPRPSISYGNLKEIAKSWLTLSNQRRLTGIILESKECKNRQLK